MNQSNTNPIIGAVKGRPDYEGIETDSVFGGDMSRHSYFGLSTTRGIVYYMIGVFIFFAWYQGTVNLMYEGNVFAFEDFSVLAKAFFIGYIPILLLFIGNTYIVFKLKMPLTVPKKIAVDLVLSQLVATGVNLLFVCIALLLGKSPTVNWLMTLILNFFALCINEIVFFVMNYERQMRVSTALEYSVLRSQVNPHFIFNSLNILHSLVYLDRDKSGEFILSLSGMYRYIMSRRESRIVTLAEEMEFLDSYVEVLNIVYYDRLKVEILGRENITDQKVVPFTLQLLMENATKHNVLRKDDPLRVTIDIKPDHLTVTNIKKVKSDDAKTDPSSGVGLRYLRELYRYAGKDCVVEDGDKEFKVNIQLIK